MLKPELHHKDQRVRDLLAWLAGRLPAGFTIVDHWEIDPAAIGVAAANDPQQLAYIFCHARPDENYYVELEAPPDRGADVPPKVIGKFDSLDHDELAELIRRHLGLG